MKMHKLFLDDFRLPSNVMTYRPHKVYTDEDWIVVKSYDEFVDMVEFIASQNEWFSLVSFDHDLADEHYVPKEYWEPIELSQEYQSKQEYKEKTGKDCAEWFVNFCKENELELPDIMIHSMNPVGTKNIYNVFSN